MGEKKENEFLERIREREKLKRKLKRDKFFNESRPILGICEISSITPIQIKDICKKIKNKKTAEEDDFKLLKRGLIMNEENIHAFFTVDGALQGLIRELTGYRADRQLEAANCLCNLSLGNERETYLVAKASSAYLIIHLNSLNWHLVDICMWTLGNLCSSKEVWKLLKQQGFIKKIIHLLDHTSDDIIISTVYALNHYLNIGIDYMSNERLSQVASKICLLLHNDVNVSLTLFLLSSKPFLDAIFINKLIIPQIIQKLAEPEKNPKVTSLYVRCLANWCTENSGRCALQIFEESKNINSFWPNLILMSPKRSYSQEVMWFLGNLFSHHSLEISNLTNKVLIENLLTLQHIIKTFNP